MITVSVIIPVYNVKSFLQETIDSVLHQTYSSFEIILVDDGSNDGSETLCDHYRMVDPRIKVIHQENQGLSCARNTGLEHMTGDLVVFLDGDDTLHPEMISRTVDALVGEDADIVMCKSMYFWTEDRMAVEDLSKVNPAGEAGKYVQDEIICAVVDGKILHNAWGKLYKAGIWKDLRFPAGQVYEDTYLILEVMEKADCVVIMEDPLVMHRKRKGSITLTASLQNFQDCCKALDHFSECAGRYVPKLFSDERLKKVRAAHLNSLLLYVLLRVDKRNPEKGRINNAFADYIRKFDRTIGLNQCGKKTQAACRLFLRCPDLLQQLYPMYTGLKNHQARILGN